MSRANMAGAILVDANLRDAQLVRVNAMSALFIRADLRDADLSWANLSGADLSEALLMDAVLVGVTWSTQTVWPGEVRGNVERISRRIGPETWIILPMEADDRVSV
ncbi:pentapeptide repeat-containing protein [Micromonospora sp. STR1_7]|uniref:Pentapeptide repeat-containing protein n=1 Tax=Micromonospora parastrephiae TaxID=2806101 RepID=A0ABS1Y2E2_9ACTN|nr:pentapeptide repeat-containing protein [Micromonospora parastrephiae]